MITFLEGQFILGFSEKADGDLSFYSMAPEMAEKSWNCIDVIEKYRLSFPAYVQQVHSNEVCLMETIGSGQSGIADAIITSLKDQVVGVFSADCLPVIVTSESMGGAIHAGWRGTLHDICGQTVNRLVDEHRVTVETVKAFIGPCIGCCCLEMGNEVYDEFVAIDSSYSDFFVKREKWFLDLSRMNRFQLIRAGVRAENITNVGRCTFCEDDSFFSFRRQKQRNGSMFSFVVKRK